MFHYFQFNSGTNEFTISISHCGYDWTEQVTNILDDPRPKTCETLSKHEYNIGKVARYVRFQAKSIYGMHSALGYFNIDYDSSITQPDDDFVCPGKKKMNVTSFAFSDTVQ